MKNSKLKFCALVLCAFVFCIFGQNASPLHASTKAETAPESGAEPAKGGNETAKADAAATPDSSAVETVKDIQRAIDGSNVDAFLRRVDLEAVISQASDIFLKRLPAVSDKMAEKQMLPPMLVLASSAVNKGPASMEYQTAKMFISAAAKQFVKDGIESGAFAGKKSANRQGLTDELFAAVSKGRKELAYPKLESEKRGVNTVGVMFKDHGTGDVFPLLLEMHSGADVWKVKKITNLEEVFKTLEKQLELR